MPGDNEPLTEEEERELVKSWEGGEEDSPGYTRVSWRSDVLRLLATLRKARRWDDAPQPEDEAIRAAFPTRTGRHETYGEAMRLVGARRSKGSLVALVNWLLVRAEGMRTALEAIRTMMGPKNRERFVMQGPMAFASIYRAVEDALATPAPSKPAAASVSGRLMFLEQGIELMRLEPNGDVFIHGRLVTNDAEIVAGLRAMIQGALAVPPAPSEPAFDAPPPDWRGVLEALVGALEECIAPGSLNQLGFQAGLAIGLGVDMEEDWQAKADEIKRRAEAALALLVPGRKETK